MYSTCIFCNNALGTNEVLENFSVGRKLAFDAGKGRLWVICRACHLWNLSPIETRWEAIEDAEREFRDAKLRVSTDNIGLARVSEGLELVRIGAPARPEFAAWRYGARFGGRYKKSMLSAAILACIPISLVVGANTHLFPHSFPIAGAMLSTSTASMLFSRHMLWKLNKQIRMSVRDNQGTLLQLTRANAVGASLFPSDHTFNWQITVPHSVIGPAPRWARSLGYKQIATSDSRPTLIQGDAAIRALSSIMPAVNAGGGTKSSVDTAVEILSDSPNLGETLRKGTVGQRDSNKFFRLTAEQTFIRLFPPHVRLAIEMSVHEDDERRAMEGELQELEQRWKDADAVAKIADELLLPQSIDREVNAMKAQKNRDQSE